MEYYSIKNDFYYEISGSVTSRSFAIYDGDEIIYTGRAVKRPGGNIRINVGRIVRDYLENEMPDFREYDGVVVEHPDAMKTFSLVNSENGDTMETYRVLMDYEDDWNGSDMVLNEPINTHADPRQKIFYGHVSSGETSVDIDSYVPNPQIVFDSPFSFGWESGVTTICYTANTDFTLSSVSGGWFSVTQAKADEFTGCLTFTYSENSGDSRNGTICMEAEDGVQCFPVVQQKHVVEYYFNLLTPAYQVIGSGSTYYTIEWDTNYDSVKYSYNSGATITTTSSSLTLSFPVNETDADITRSVVFYNSGGTILGTAVWKQEHEAQQEYYFNFLTPDGRYIAASDTAYTITWDTNYPSVVYVFNGNRTTTSSSGATLTFPANASSATTIPFSVSAYTIGGVLLGTLTWSQMPVYVPGQFDHEYLYFDILSDDDDLKWEKQATTGETIEYSKDNKQTWTAISDGKIPTSAGDRIYLRGNNTSYADYWSSEGCSKLGGNTRFNVGGNIMSLIYGDDFEGKTRFKDACYEGYGLPNNVFDQFFRGCNVVNAYELSLPATDLPLGSQESLFPTGVYEWMFWNCTALVTAPAYLPATTLNERCYLGMFEGCSSLSTTPILPATTMDISCYANMFKGCSSLTIPPTLPATNLAAGCYSGMFWNCASLANAPSLPATTMATNCYITMFFGCTSLTTAPSLPSTDLADGCYNGMFRYCSSLVNAPALPATTLANSCYQEMFSYCTSLEIAPVLPAINLVESCYYVMFEECSKLKYIKCLATPDSNCTNWWVRNVPEGSNGTFVKRSGTRWSAGFNGIPYGWNVIEE